jgi:hypothetical protein
MLRKKLTAVFAACAMVFAISVPLSGCAALSGWFSSDPSAKIASAAADAQILLNGLQGAMITLKSNPLIAGPKLDQAMLALDDLSKTVTALHSAATLSAAQPLVLQIATDVAAMSGVVATLPGLPPEVGLAFGAASVLIPVIADAVQAALAASQKPAVVPTARTFSPDEARAILLGAAAKAH